MAQDNHFTTDETGLLNNSSNNNDYNRGGQVEGGDNGGGIIEDSIENQLFPDLPFPDQSYFAMNSTPTTSQTSAAAPGAPGASGDRDDFHNSRGGHRGTASGAQALVSNESLASFTAAAEPLSSQLSPSTAAMAPAVPPFPLPPPSAAATAAAAAVAAAATASTSSSTTGIEPSVCGSSSLILDGTTLHVANIGQDGNPPSGSPAPTASTVPEFLYQLTKMLTDNNRDIIEWSKGKIEVHSPHKLETHVLNRYFRHSKFASFQRQLNYFGFRKQAGKGKMAPCSYVNDDTTDELASLLNIKRKPGGEGNPKRGGKKREREDGKGDKKGNRGRSQSDLDAGASATTVASVVNPVLAGILHKSGSGGLKGVLSSSTSDNDHRSSGSARAVNPSQRDIARVAVGRGIRHGLTKSQIQARPRATAVQSSSGTLAAHSGLGSQVVGSSPVQEGLNALTSNFRNSMNDLQQAAGITHGQVPQQPLSGSASSRNRGYVPGSLRRDDSLVDLAMIPLLDESGHDSDANPTAEGNNSGFDFVDFPFDTDFFNDRS